MRLIVILINEREDGGFMAEIPQTNKPGEPFNRLLGVGATIPGALRTLSERIVEVKSKAGCQYPELFGKLANHATDAAKRLEEALGRRVV